MDIHYDTLCEKCRENEAQGNKSIYCEKCQKDKATPRPWKIEARQTIVSGNDLTTIGHCGKSGGFYTEKDTANASLIVKAVNNHDALLEAVKKALHVHIDYVRESGDDSQEANEYQEMLSNVIAQATK